MRYAAVAAIQAYIRLLLCQHVCVGNQHISLELGSSLLLVPGAAVTKPPSRHFYRAACNAAAVL